MMCMRTVEKEQEHGKYVPLQLALALAMPLFVQRELQRDILSVFYYFFCGARVHHKRGRRS